MGFTFQRCQEHFDEDKEKSIKHKRKQYNMMNKK